MRKTLLAMIVMLACLPACRASDSVKQGLQGEFCNGRDDDCRSGLICEQGVCTTSAAQTASITCSDMCQRLQECQTGEQNCLGDCQATIAGTCKSTPCPWSPTAVDAFGKCITQELTCEQARQADAPTTCYRRIPIVAARSTRCDAFVAAATRCKPGVDTTNLRDRCYLLGRTNTDQSWSRTDPCVDSVSGGMCTDIASCFNSVFELDPKLDLGSGTISPGTNNATNNQPVGTTGPVMTGTAL